MQKVSNVTQIKNYPLLCTKRDHSVRTIAMKGRKAVIFLGQFKSLKKLKMKEKNVQRKYLKSFNFNIVNQGKLSSQIYLREAKK